MKDINIAKNIIALRKNKGITQEQLAVAQDHSLTLQVIMLFLICLQPIKKIQIFTSQTVVILRIRPQQISKTQLTGIELFSMAKALKVNSHMLWIQMETLYSAKDIIPITVQSGLLTQHLSAEKIQKCNVLELLSLQKAGFLVLMIAAVTLDLTQNHLRRLIASLINFINEIQICLTSVLNGGNEYEK